ncbi:tetratricopeptide repeat protein [Spongorhabdus nitratireducens]
MEQETALKLLEALELLNSNMQNLAYLLGFILAGILAMGVVSIWVDLRSKKQQDIAKTASLQETQEHSPEFDPVRAEDLYARGQVEELITYCEAFQQEYPNDVQIYWYLGLAYFTRDEMSQARINFEQVIKINPNWKDPVSGYLAEIESTDNNYLPRSLSLQ